MVDCNHNSKHFQEEMPKLPLIHIFKDPILVRPRAKEDTLLRSMEKRPAILLMEFPIVLLLRTLSWTPSYTNLAAAEVDGIVSPAEGHSRQNTGQSASRQSISSHRARNGSLPADDGMSRTRRRIIEIREMDPFRI